MWIGDFVLSMRILNNRTQLLHYFIVKNIEIYFRGFLLSGMLMSDVEAHLMLHIVGWQAQQ